MSCFYSLALSVWVSFAGVEKEKGEMLSNVLASIALILKVTSLWFGKEMRLLLECTPLGRAEHSLENCWWSERCELEHQEWKWNRPISSLRTDSPINPGEKCISSSMFLLLIQGSWSGLLQCYAPCIWQAELDTLCGRVSVCQIPQVWLMLISSRSRTEQIACCLHTSAYETWSSLELFYGILREL